MELFSIRWCICHDYQKNFLTTEFFKIITGNIYYIIYNIYLHNKYNIYNKIKLFFYISIVSRLSRKEQYKRSTLASWCSIERTETRKTREEDKRERSCKETQYPLGWRVIRIEGWTNRRKETRKTGRSREFSAFKIVTSSSSESTYRAQFSACT